MSTQSLRGSFSLQHFFSPFRSLLALSLFLALSFLAAGDALASRPTPGPATLSEAEWEQLREGEFVVRTQRGDTNMGDVTAVVEAPPEKVWAVVSDFATYAVWMDHIATSEVVSVSGDSMVGRGVTKVPFPISNRRWDVNIEGGSRTVNGETHYSGHWSYIEGSGNINDVFGFWYVQPLEGDTSKSLVRYYLLANLGIWIPNGILNWATRRMLPGLMADLRSEVARRG